MEKNLPQTIFSSPANSYYCGLLQNLFAGNEGELASSLQFRYQQYVLLPFDEKISQIFANIARQDEKHQELLAKMIISVGGNPVFFNAQGKWFSTRSIDYVKSIKAILPLAIELKEKTVVDYLTTISKITYPELTATLTRILRDEENHLEILKSLEKDIELR